MLNREDLRTAAEENKAAEAKKQAQKSLGVYAERVRQHAKDLMAPASIASFSFLWYSLFGLLMMFGGLVHGLAIGAILGAPPSKKNFHLIAAIMTLATIFLVLASAGVIFYISDYKTWQLDVDPFAKSLGSLTDKGLTSYPDEATALAAVETVVPHLETPACLILFIIYAAIFVAAIVVDIKTIVCCMKAAQELSSSEVATITTSQEAGSSPQQPVSAAFA